LGFFKKIKLENYRNFENFEFNFVSGCNVFFGKNGSGKTNILEAISLFDKGKGFRKDNIKNLINKNYSKDQFKISSTFNYENQDLNLDLFNENKKDIQIKKIFINGNSSKESLIFFENLISLIYFLPDMERLFVASPSLRRNFLDRLLFSFNKNYNVLINNYKKNLYERQKLLKNHKFDQEWINTLESKIVELGMEIYKKRIEHISILNLIFNDTDIIKSNLYRIKLNIDDELLNKKEIDIKNIKEKYLFDIKKSREIDVLLGGCKVGPHKSDIFGINTINDFNINQYSTGQQKTIILLIIIAHCKYLIKNCKRKPILLFDEVCSHLDTENRKLLIQLIEILNVQIFLTGTEKDFFSFLSTKASYCNINKK
tara:strand:- start:104 stop:1216 length:1113 start_codon:yes stop_codon:yes gene_type:complete